MDLNGCSARGLVRSYRGHLNVWCARRIKVKEIGCEDVECIHVIQ